MTDNKSDNIDLKPHKEPDETNTKNKKLKIILFASLLFFTILILAAVFREDGIIKIHHLNKNLEIVKSEITSLEKENKRLNAEVYSLKTDLSAVEKIARENLGLVKPDEVIFEFINNIEGEQGLEEIKSSAPLHKKKEEIYGR